jgi:hypothetical protein
MTLIARRKHCFSNQFVLLARGKPIGEFRNRWLGERIDIQLLERRHLLFERVGLFSTQYVLSDDDGQTLASARKAGFLSSRWDLELPEGSAEMERKGLLSSRFVIERNGSAIADVGCCSFFSTDWQVESDGSLQDTSCLLIGLVYHAIRRRRRNSSNT